MRLTLAGLSVSMVFGVALCAAPYCCAQDQAAAQEGPAYQESSAATRNGPDYTSVNCSSFVSDNVPREMRLISGENSVYKIAFTQGDSVFINRGSDKGVHVGDRFTVLRPTSDPSEVTWFKDQHKLMKAMGQMYQDEGQIRVINVSAHTSVAEVAFACGYMERGDIVRPFVERPVPQFREASAFDRFAPVSGKRVAMIVSGTNFTQALGKNNSAFVNLGSNQGVHLGDYFRVFRYQGTVGDNGRFSFRHYVEGGRAEAVPQTPGYQYKILGFGSTPEVYTWNDLPRQLVGEGMVFNEGPNGSTIMITYCNGPIFAGDYVELE
jgi:hypothetical protein